MTQRPTIGEIAYGTIILIGLPFAMMFDLFKDMTGRWRG